VAIDWLLIASGVGLVLLAIPFITSPVMRQAGRVDAGRVDAGCVDDAAPLED
jgi:hypothetical protein